MTTTSDHVGISLAVVRVLMLGLTQMPRRFDSLDTETRDALRALWRGGEKAIAGYWWEHETELRRLASAHGITAYRGREFFAEGVARRVAEQIARRARRQ